MIYLLTSNNYEQSFTVGITTCPIEAEKLKQEYLIKLKEKKNRYSEEQQQILDKEIEELPYEFFSKEQEDYWKWKYLFMAEEFEEVVNIKELPLNTIICNNLND